MTDPDRFAAQLDHLVTHYRPVSGTEVARAVRGEVELPRRAVWVTFDDAHAGVLANGLPLLDRVGVPATLFVCPGVMDSEEPYWWQVIDYAVGVDYPIEFEGRMWADRRLVSRLKQVDDGRRRELVADVRAGLRSLGLEPRVTQLTSDGLLRWVASGRDVGNHSWEHPCLDMCSEREQERQIVQAHEHLGELLGEQTRLFAYPNGNETHHAEHMLRRLGYDLIARFDHRPTPRPDMLVSRFRIDAETDLARMRAIVSGGHAAAFGVVSELRTSGRQTGETAGG